MKTVMIFCNKKMQLNFIDHPGIGNCLDIIDKHAAIVTKRVCLY